MAGKQSQANKNFWYAYALWQQKVAQALARRRAEELARKRAEAEAQSNQPLVMTKTMRNMLLLALSVGLLLLLIKPHQNTKPKDEAYLRPYDEVEQSCGLLYPSDTMDTIRCSIGAALTITTSYLVVENSRFIAENFGTPLCWILAIGCPWYDLGIESYANSNTLPHTQAFPQIQTQQPTHPLENDDTDVRPTDGVVNPNRPDDDQYIILYHYTLENRVNSITRGGLLPSIQPLEGGDDARYGNGQYFTDLTPEEASTVTRGQLAYALFEDFRRWGSRTPIAWMRFQFSIKDVQWVDKLHGARFPHRSIYLRGGTDTLSMTGILLDTGLVTFSIND